MDKFELLCLLEAISHYAYDIHYTSKGRLFFSDHLFSERLADVDVADDYIETFFLGKSEEAPSSADIAREVAKMTPEITDDQQGNFKRLRNLIIRALMVIENYKGTKGEEDLLGSVAHILQRHNGLLYRQLTYTPAELQNNNEDWEDIVTPEDTAQTLDNEKWITVHPSGKENPDDYRRVKVEDGETSKEAVERKFGKKKDEKKEAVEEKPTPKYKVKDASSVKEAEQYARDAGLADNVNYGKLDLAYVNTVNQSLAENLNEFPEVRKYMKYLGSIQSVNKDLQAKTLEENEEKIKASVQSNLDRLRYIYDENFLIHRYGSMEKLEKTITDRVRTKYKNAVTHKATGEYANFTYGSKSEPNNMGIRFNEKFGTKSGIEEGMKRCVDTTYHPENCTTLKSVIDHEFGHVIDYAIREKGKYDLDPKSYIELRQYYQNSSKDEIKQGLSRYATENFKEFIAEGYSEYKNNPQPREMAQKIGTLLTQAYKEIFENGRNN